MPQVALEMKPDKNFLVGLEVGHRAFLMLILSIAGPLLGLGYIIALSFIGLISFIPLSGYRAKQSLATMGRQATQAIADVPEGARGEAVGLRDFLQPLIAKRPFNRLNSILDILVTVSYRNKSSLKL